MPQIVVQNITTNYREWGSGDLILLALHGWPADSSHYAELGPALAQKGLRVIVPDLPGWGATPAPSAAWTVSDYQKFVAAFAESLGLKEFVLFGHSFGGRIAIKFVLAYPYAVRAVVLCAAAGIRPNPYTAKRRAIKLLARTGKLLFAAPGINQLAPLAKKLLYRAVGSDDYNQAQGVMKSTIIKVLAEDLTALLPEIKRPTLLLWGGDDGATPLSQGQLMAKQIPQAKLVVYTGQRHNLPKLIPEQLATDIAEFVRSDAVKYIT